MTGNTADAVAGLSLASAPGGGVKAGGGVGAGGDDTAGGSVASGAGAAGCGASSADGAATGGGTWGADSDALTSLMRSTHESRLTGGADCGWGAGALGTLAVALGGGGVAASRSGGGVGLPYGVSWLGSDSSGVAR